MVITKRILSSILFMGIAGGIFYFMFRQIVTDWPLIASYPWKITWLPMISSLGLAIIASALAIKAAHILCSVLGGKVSFPRFLYIFCLTQVGRYLPGKFWHLVSFAMLIEREKVKRSVSIVLPFLFQGIMIAIFWLVGTILCGPFIKGRLIPDFSWLAYLSAFVILFVLLFLPFLTGLLNHLINLKYKEVKYFYLPRKGYYTALSFFILSGLTFSSAFLIFVSSLITVSMDNAPLIGGSFLLSYVIGWVVFIVPGGLGIREGVLAFLLSTLLSPVLSNVLALAARVWMTVAEFILLVGVWVWVRLLRGEKFPFMNSTSGTKSIDS